MATSVKKFKIRKGDTVIVNSGAHKGKTGEVLRILRADDRAVVQGVNVVKRAQKPSQINPQGGYVNKELPIHISNLSHVDPKSGTATRVRYNTLKDGTKVRMAVKSGEVITETEKSASGAQKASVMPKAAKAATKKKSADEAKPKAKAKTAKSETKAKPAAKKAAPKKTATKKEDK